MRSLAIVAVFAALVPAAAAQRGAGGGHFGGGGHLAAPLAHASRGFVRGSYRGMRFDRYGAPYYYSLPFPFFDDYPDSGDPYSSGYPVAATLPPFLPPMRSVRDVSDFAESAPARENSQPLMIELKNGQYVRVASAAIDGEASPLAEASNAAPGRSPVGQSDGPTMATQEENLPPAVLIFRDGHNEEVRDYTIADGILYARGDFYTDGYWNKKIDLAALDIIETLHANNVRNVKFVLPSSPNEVITRP
jgi:hypothetical protein